MPVHPLQKAGLLDKQNVQDDLRVCKATDGAVDKSQVVSIVDKCAYPVVPGNPAVDSGVVV